MSSTTALITLCVRGTAALESNSVGRTKRFIANPPTANITSGDTISTKCVNDSISNIVRTQLYESEGYKSPLKTEHMAINTIQYSSNRISIYNRI